MAGFRLNCQGILPGLESPRTEVYSQLVRNVKSVAKRAILQFKSVKARLKIQKFPWLNKMFLCS